MKGIEKSATSKTTLVAALKDGVEYCNKASASMTDSKGSQVVKFFDFDMARLALFSLNTAHTDEHYGNMVTYMRLKGIVPPTSEKPACACVEVNSANGNHTSCSSQSEAKGWDAPLRRTKKGRHWWESS